MRESSESVATTYWIERQSRQQGVVIATIEGRARAGGKKSRRTAARTASRVRLDEGVSRFCPVAERQTRQCSGLRAQVQLASLDDETARTGRRARWFSDVDVLQLYQHVGIIRSSRRESRDTPCALSRAVNRALS